MALIYEQGGGSCTDFIGPLEEDQTFIPMVLNMPEEGQPTLMDKLQYIESKGDDLHNAINDIKGALAVGIMRSVNNNNDGDDNEEGDNEAVLESARSLLAIGTDAKSLDMIEGKVDAMEGNMKEMGGKVDAMDGSIKAVEGNVKAVEGKVEEMKDMIMQMMQMMQQNSKSVE